MLKYRAVSVLLSVVLFGVVAATGSATNRNKRQAPNTNVHDIPKTSFTCEGKNVGEYYADPEVQCQVYHVCIPGMNNKLSLISFVCPNGTIFSQATKVCTPYERVDCSLTSQFYSHDSKRRTEYESDDYDNYVPPPPPRQPAPQPPRQSAPSRSRNTPAPPPPPPTAATQPPRGNRFRSNNQFRGQQAPPSTTRAPSRATPTAAAPQPARSPIVPARPAPPAFRPPVLAARPPQAGVPLANILPPRPTARAVISTSTSNYNYEYEYEYDYEDETAPGDQANTRTKREISSDEYDSADARDQKSSGFTCEDKVPGAAYADIESNCEMFHICVLLGKYKILDYKVACANGTAFDQETGSCIEKEAVVCGNSHLFYQFEKPNQTVFNKKAVTDKKMYSKSKKPTGLSKE